MCITANLWTHKKSTGLGSEAEEDLLPGGRRELVRGVQTLWRLLGPILDEQGGGEVMFIDFTLAKCLLQDREQQRFDSHGSAGDIHVDHQLSGFLHRLALGLITLLFMSSGVDVVVTLHHVGLLGEVDRSLLRSTLPLL